MYATKQPYQVFTDKSGNPLENGKLYFGVANQDPEVYPQAVFWDVAGTIPAVQPIRTIGGYPVYNGSPAIIYCNSFYSLTARDKNGVFQYTFPDSSVYDTPTSVAGSNVFSSRNLLLNATFTINQRSYASGTNVAAASTYTLDRWAVMTAGQNITFTPNGIDNTVIAPAGGLQQAIEAWLVSGGVYTISWEGTAGCQINGNNVTNGQNITLPANTTVFVRFIGGSVTRPQLEKSPSPTQFDRRFPQQEYLLCLRYARLVYDKTMVMGIAASTTLLQAHYTFEVQMRVPPTVSTIFSGEFYISDDYSANFNTTSATVLNSSMSVLGGRIAIDGFTGLTTGRVYGSGVNGGLVGSNRILLSAEM